jgi:hypothetical protein
MSIRSNHRFTLRHAAFAMAVAALPLTAFAWGSQAGDNGQQPVGADNDGPRQAIPNETSNDVPIETQIRHQIANEGGSVYYVAPPSQAGAPPDCDRQPLAERAECRDAAAARYDVAGDAYVESYPAYMTYYYPYPGGPVYWRYDTYAAAPDRYVATPDDDHAYRSYGTYDSWSTAGAINPCAPVFGGARDECLHGTLSTR